MIYIIEAQFLRKKLSLNQFQFFLDFLGKPMPDQGLIGYGFHSSKLFDSSYVEWIDLDGNIF